MSKYKNQIKLIDFTFGSKFVLFLKVVYKVVCIAMASLSLCLKGVFRQSVFDLLLLFLPP